jgi:hypothetical protein
VGVDSTIDLAHGQVIAEVLQSSRKPYASSCNSGIGSEHFRFPRGPDGSPLEIPTCIPNREAVSQSSRVLIDLPLQRHPEQFPGGQTQAAIPDSGSARRIASRRCCKGLLANSIVFARSFRKSQRSPKGLHDSMIRLSQTAVAPPAQKHRELMRGNRFHQTLCDIRGRDRTLQRTGDLKEIVRSL